MLIGEVDPYNEFDDESIFDGGSNQVLEQELSRIFQGPEYEMEEAVFSSFDEIVADLDFSSFQGQAPFKRTFSNIKTKINDRRGMPKRKSLVPRKPLDKNISVGKYASLFGTNRKKMGRILVPDNRPVIVEGASKFILADSKDIDCLRNIGYYKGKKLNELLLTFNNDSALDFNFTLFDPSMQMDYLFSTGQNLNDKIEVAGGSIKYSDVCYNILANPIIVRNCKFIITGPQKLEQRAIPLQIQDKYTNGITRVVPLNLALQVDTMQVEGNTISFDIACNINRAFIPDGMDVIGYTILAGNTITMCFYYEQKSLKKLFYEEARHRGPRNI